MHSHLVRMALKTCTSLGCSYRNGRALLTVGGIGLVVVQRN